jgi:hypothetical protein
LHKRKLPFTRAGGLQKPVSNVFFIIIIIRGDYAILFDNEAIVYIDQEANSDAGTVILSCSLKPRLA